MSNSNDKEPAKRSYPPFWEKFIPIALVVILLIIILLLVVIIGVALGIFP